MFIGYHTCQKQLKVHRNFKEMFKHNLVWFEYLNRYKFDQGFLYMKYSLKHITFEKKEVIKMLLSKIV